MTQAPALTDEQVLAAMDPNGAVIKYGEIVAPLEIMLGLNGNQLYRAADPVLRRMKRSGKIERIKGAGAGWRIITQEAPATLRLQSESVQPLARETPTENPATTALSPVLVEKYLRRTGWDEPQRRSATFATFRRGLTWLDVPVCAEHFQYPEHFQELLGKLAKIESRPVARIVEDINTADITAIAERAAAKPTTPGEA